MVSAGSIQIDRKSIGRQYSMSLLARSTRVPDHRGVNMNARLATADKSQNVAGRLLVALYLLSLLFIFGTTSTSAQQTADTPQADQQMVRMLLQRVEQLQARDQQLEARVAALEKSQRDQAQSAKTSHSSPLPQVQPVGPETQSPVAQSEEMGQETMDVGKTRLNIRGFGDFTFHGDTQKGDTTSFSLGDLDLFITSSISERFKFLTELVFEVHKNNEFEEDLERVLVEYSLNDHLRLAAGRYHTAIGYYNTSHHHTNWFETAVDRPFLFNFEDEGGILPTHSVGLSATGEIPSGKLGLSYVAEVGNGRTSSSPLLQPVQNLIDENNHKDVNFQIFSRPDAVPGLQVGFSTYRDVLFPLRQPKIGETIFDAYAVIVRPKFEWLNEAMMIRHAPLGSRVYDTPGFYTQISESFGPYRPFFRYQYINASDTEPVFPTVGLRTGPAAGLRYAVNDSIALKFQYDYTQLRKAQAVNSLALQVGFTF